MKLQELLVGLVIFILVILGGTAVLVDVNTHYGTNISTTEYQEMNDSTEMYNLSKDMESAVLNGSVDDQESWESMTKGAYSGARLVKNSPGMVSKILTSIADYLKIPGYFVGLALIALIILVVFAIIYLIMRFQPTG